MTKVTELETKIAKLANDLSFAETDTQYSKISLALKLAKTELEAEVENQAEATEKAVQLAASRKKAEIKRLVDAAMVEISASQKAMPALETAAFTALEAAFTALEACYDNGLKACKASDVCEGNATFLGLDVNALPQIRTIQFQQGAAPIDGYFEFVARWFFTFRQTLQTQLARGDKPKVSSIGSFCLTQRLFDYL